MPNSELKRIYKMYPHAPKAVRFVAENPGSTLNQIMVGAEMSYRVAIETVTALRVVDELIPAQVRGLTLWWRRGQDMTVAVDPVDPGTGGDP
jgi:hypothetical protein